MQHYAITASQAPIRYLLLWSIAWRSSATTSALNGADSTATGGWAQYLLEQGADPNRGRIPRRARTPPNTRALHHSAIAPQPRHARASCLTEPFSQPCNKKTARGDWRLLRDVPDTAAKLRSTAPPAAFADEEAIQLLSMQEQQRSLQRTLTATRR